MAKKLALVVRTDLGMGRGKIAAQVAHAAVQAVLDNLSGGDVAAWVKEGQPKVVLRVPTGEDLSRVVRRAKAAGLPAMVICDAGRTQVEAGTSTCGAIGPADTERIDSVTGDLSLL